jgi:hypothetical protein
MRGRCDWSSKERFIIFAPEVIGESAFLLTRRHRKSNAIVSPRTAQTIYRVDGSLRMLKAHLRFVGLRLLFWSGKKDG